jgi:hypothetical protein
MVEKVLSVLLDTFIFSILWPIIWERHFYKFIIWVIRGILVILLQLFVSHPHRFSHTGARFYYLLSEAATTFDRSHSFQRCSLDPPHSSSHSLPGLAPATTMTTTMYSYLSSALVAPLLPAWPHPPETPYTTSDASRPGNTWNCWILSY